MIKAPREWLEQVYVTENFEIEHKNVLDGIDYEVVEERIFTQMRCV